MSGFLPGMHDQMLSVLGNPATDGQKWALLAVCLVALFAGLDRISTWLGSPLQGPGGAAGASIIGFLLFLTGLQAAAQFIPADIQAKETLFTALSLSVITGGVIAPLTARLYSSSWIKAMIAWTLSAALAAGVMAITHAAFDSLFTGQTNTHKFQEEPDY